MSQHALHDEQPHPRFVRLAEWVIAHQRFTLGVSLLLSALSIWAILSSLSVDNSLDVFAPAEAEVMKSRERYRDLFGRDDLFMVAVKGEVFSAEYLSRLAALERAVQGLEVEVDSLGYRRGGDASAAAKPPLKGDEPAELGLEELGLEELGDFGEEGEDAWGEQEGGSVVEQTTSLISARRTLQREGGLVIERWFDPIPSGEELKSRAELALSDPQLKRRLVDDEGRLSVILVRVAFMHDQDLGVVYSALEALVSAHQAEGFKIQVTGPPAVNAALNELVLNDLSKLLILSGLAMFLALLWLFRRGWLIVGPMIVVSVSVLWTVGVMAALGMGLNILSSILPAFLLCVGLGDSIHVQSIYLNLRRRGLEHDEAIPRACGLTGPPVLFTSLTTMIGLFSFHFATVTAVKQMGLAGGIGVIFAFGHSVISLPIFMSWSRSDAPREPKSSTAIELKPDLLDRALSWMVGLSSGRLGQGLICLSSAILLSIAGYGISRLEVWHDDLETLPDDQPIKAAVREADAALGGVASAQLVIDAEGAYGVKGLELLKGLDALSEHLYAYREPDGTAIVGHVISPLDVIKETRQALLSSGEDPTRRFYELPQTQEEASQLMSLFELQSPDELRQLATIDLRSAHMTLQVKWREATSYERLIQHIDEGIKEHIGDLAQLEPTGGIYLAYTIVSSLLSDLLWSFSGAFIVITLLMVLMLKSLKLGALAMIPNLAPIALMLGALGLVGVPLDLNNLLIASIALGIAVDDTIHFLHHFQAVYRQTGELEPAIEGARVSAGRAMVSTSLLLGSGFIVYLFASTEAVQRFGVLIALTLVTALVVDLILCPAILRLAYPAQRVLDEGALS